MGTKEVYASSYTFETFNYYFYSSYEGQQFLILTAFLKELVDLALWIQPLKKSVIISGIYCHFIFFPMLNNMKVHLFLCCQKTMALDCAAEIYYLSPAEWNFKEVLEQ